MMMHTLLFSVFPKKSQTCAIWLWHYKDTFRSGKDRGSFLPPAHLRLCLSYAQMLQTQRRLFLSFRRIQQWLVAHPQSHQSQVKLLLHRLEHVQLGQQDLVSFPPM